MNRKKTAIFFCVFLLFMSLISLYSARAFAISQVDTTEENKMQQTIKGEASEDQSDYNNYVSGDMEDGCIPAPSTIIIPDENSIGEEEIAPDPVPPKVVAPVKAQPQPKKQAPPKKQPQPKPQVKQGNDKIITVNPTDKAAYEKFMGSKKLTSKTGYLIWVNTSTQRIHVFKNLNNTWKLHKTFICATGKDATPTVKGVFKTLGKAYFVFDKKYNCYLKNVTRFYRGYLFHSVILNKYGQVIDGTLGRKKSHGCVRMSLKDSEWLYKTLPLGTTVFVN